MILLRLWMKKSVYACTYCTYMYTLYLHVPCTYYTYMYTLYLHVHTILTCTYCTYMYIQYLLRLWMKKSVYACTYCTYMYTLYLHVPCTYYTYMYTLYLHVHTILTCTYCTYNKMLTFRHLSFIPCKKPIKCGIQKEQLLFSLIPRLP